MTSAQNKFNVIKPSAFLNAGVGAGNREVVSSPERVVSVEDQSIRITAYYSWAQLEERIPAWENILNENPASSIFSTPEWLGSWWKAFGSNRQMVALAFSNGSGELVGLAPLYLDDSRRVPFGRLKCLRLVGDGSGDSDNIDLIIQPGFEKACAQALLRWLVDQPDWDVCCLNTLPENSTAARALLRELKAAKWPLMPGTCRNAAIHLPITWQSYVETLAPDFRALVTRYPRRLANRYQVRIYRCEDSSQLPGGLEVLFTLHQKRWRKANYPGSFVSQERREFYLHMAESFLRRGWLELWFLELNGTTVATQFCFRYRDSAYILQEGFDPDYAADKVGYALRAAMLQHFIHAGIKRYDFLGAFSAHKQNWGARPGSYLNLGFAAPGSFGSYYLIFDNFVNKSKEWLRDHLPSRAWNALRRLKIQRYGEAVSNG